MGYYGLGPGMNSRMADKLTELEQLLRKLPLDKALEILELLEKICKNVCHNPTEPKFRQVNVTTAKTAPLLGLPCTEAVMREIGWQRQGDYLMLPAEARLDFQGHVVKIIEVKDFYKKEAEKAKKFEKLAADPAKAAIQQQMAIDRLERQAQANAQTNAPAAAPVAGPAALAAAPATAATPAPAPTYPAATAVPVTTPSSPAPATKESAAAPMLLTESPAQPMKEENDAPVADIKAIDDIRALQQQRYERAKAERPRMRFCLPSRRAALA